MNTTNNPTGRRIKIACPSCGKKHFYTFGSLIGQITSPAKRAASIKNGDKGGRPKGSVARPSVALVAAARGGLQRRPLC